MDAWGWRWWPVAVGRRRSAPLDELVRGKGRWWGGQGAMRLCGGEAVEVKEDWVCGSEGVCVGEGGGISRIDQALEEADCATFEDEGTITLLGSVSRRRGSQTTRGKAL